MPSDNTMTVVSNGGLRNHGGFGWLAAIMTCHGTVQDSHDQMSSYQAEATGMLFALHLMKYVMQESKIHAHFPI